MKGQHPFIDKEDIFSMKYMLHMAFIKAKTLDDKQCFQYATDFANHLSRTYKECDEWWEKQVGDGNIHVDVELLRRFNQSFK